MSAPELIQNIEAKGIPEMAGGYLPAPPRTVEESGLPFLFLVELLAKVLFQRGQLQSSELAHHVKLPLTNIDRVLDFMRAEKLCEANRGIGSLPEFVLTDTGRMRASDYMRKSQYAGVAPVSLADYTAQIQRQKITDMRITREGMQRAFANIIIDEKILNQLGAAMNSGRATFIYGPAGSGKTFIAEQLVRLLSGTIAVPHAILVENEVIQIFDPLVHHLLAEVTPIAGKLERTNLLDQRWHLCRRPVVITGGELTLSMLDLDFDDSVRFYQAPPHIKANNGIFIIDDLGRQMVSAQEIMNRWIVPMERRVDYLSLHTGYKFPLPFDVTVIFSSNQLPSQIADEAFLRRLGYKIRVDVLTEEQYCAVFKQMCDRLEIEYVESAFQHVLHDLHFKQNKPLLACYPRDILTQLRDYAIYERRKIELNHDLLGWAWNNYFAQH
jgi:predicted ATPase with chaperone activity